MSIGSSDSYTLGLHLFQAGRFSEAVGCFDQILSTNPDDAKTLNIRGLALFYEGKKNAAKQSFKKALKLKPKEAILRGDLLSNLGMYDAAISCYDKARELHPDDSGPLISKAVALVYLKKYADAIALCDIAIEMNPDLSEAWSIKGWAYGMNKMNYGAALPCFSKALEINPDFYLARLHKRAIHYNVNRLGISLCWRCNQRIRDGIEPLPFWGFDALVCKQCYETAENNTKFFNVTYVEPKSTQRKSTLNIDGILTAYSLDGMARIAFEPKQKTLALVIFDYVKSANLIDVDGIDVMEDSSANTGDTRRHCIEVNYEIDGLTDSAVIYTKEDASTLHDTITSLLPKMLKQKSIRDQQIASISMMSHETEMPGDETRDKNGTSAPD